VPSASLGDRNLRHRLVVRDVEALGEVYDLYAAVVYGLAFKVSTDRGLAEQVTQVVFLDLWRRPERFDPGHGPLRPWLANQTHRHATLAVRQAAANRRRDQQAAVEDDRAIDIDEAVQSVLKTEEVRAALAALPDDERSAIRQAYFGGKTYWEVAVEVGVAEDTITARLSSGLHRMSDSLRPEVVEQDPNRGS
jgi:RNA polymerase sigma-70 factor (ECF subfamily)